MATAAERVVVVTEDARADDQNEPVDLDRWRSLAVATLEADGQVGELTLTFIDTADIAELNAEHMGKTGPTDVLSFPMDADDDGAASVGPDGAGDVPRLLGDVVVCPAVAAAQADEHAGTYDDEIALLVVHGILHVLGHDHLDVDDTAVMRARERELLETLHWNGPAPTGFRHDHA